MIAAPLLLVTGLLLPAGTGLATDTPPATDRVTADQLARSVTTYLADNSVTVWSIDNSVTALAGTRTSGSTTTLTLGTDVLFAFGSARLDATATSTLRTRLTDVPRKARVSIVGYTDSIGTTVDNLSLSKRRARAVVKAVAGLRPDLRTSATGRGESNPVADNGSSGADNPAGRAKNRRVELSWKKP